jgi:hypothetical protein
MYDPAPTPTIPFMDAIRADAREVAKRTLRSKFGRLSNARILTILRRAAAGNRAMEEASDEDLLALWFEAFAAAREELRNG